MKNDTNDVCPGEGCAASGRRVDIGNSVVGAAVESRLNAQFYADQLEALQREAERLGLHFISRSATALSLSGFQIELLARGVARARLRHLQPGMSCGDLENDIERWVDDGAAGTLTRDILAILSTMGIVLDTTPQEKERLAELQRFLSNPTPEPSPALEKNSSS